METEWKRDILMSTKLCISEKYFRKDSFSFDKTHFVLMGTHYDAAFFMRGSHNIESIFQVSVHFPSCWFLQRVTHCSACSSISDISRSNAIIFHRIWGSLSLPSLSLVPLQAVGPCSAAPQFGGVYPPVSLRQLPGSHPRLTSCRDPRMLSAAITSAIYRWRLARGI